MNKRSLSDLLRVPKAIYDSNYIYRWLTCTRKDLFLDSHWEKVYPETWSGTLVLARKPKKQVIVEEYWDNIADLMYQDIVKLAKLTYRPDLG